MNLDTVNKWLSAGASLAVIVGVVVAIGGVVVAIHTLKETHGAASATLVLTLRDKLDDSRYARIATEIQNNNSAHPLMQKRGGKFHEIDVEGYIENFEDIGYMVRENVIVPQMAYDHFSYDVEKAWCNSDVRRVVDASQKADKSASVATDPIFGNFETLAKQYLARERQSCKDLDDE